MWERGTEVSNVGKWDWAYASVSKSDPQRYGGDDTTYRIGAEWLRDCGHVQDWGCGMGWFSQYVGPQQQYVGVDGSQTPFADKVVDLATFTTLTEGLFMRHVLEHNYQWQQVLENALQSFTKRMCLVIFTPWAEETHEIRFQESYGVPDISFRFEDISDPIDRLGASWSCETLPTATEYHVEHVFRIEK